MLLASVNSIVTLAPVSFMKPSSICFLKNSSAAVTKLDHWIIDRLTPSSLGRPAGLAAGAAWPAAGEADGEAAGTGEAAGATAGAAGGAAGAAGGGEPPQAARSTRLLVLPTMARKPRRETVGTL